MVKTGGIESGKLKSYVERVERLEEEKAGLSADIRDIFAEAKANGFDTKTIRQIIKIRKLDESKREEQEYLLELYKRALNIPSALDREAA